MTLRELKTRLLSRAGEDPAQAVFITETDAIRALNQAQQVYCFLTLCLEVADTLSVGSGAVWLNPLTAMPRYIAPLRLRWNGATSYRLRPGQISEFHAESNSWQDEPGEPTSYAALGCNLIALNRVPLAGGTITITYAASPTPLVGDTDVPEIPESDHQYLISYALWRVRMVEGGQEHAKTQEDLQQFLQAVQKMADHVRSRSKASEYDTRPAEMKYPDVSRSLFRRKNAR